MVESAPSEDADGRARRLWRTLESVADPEIPVVNIVELGVVRRVRAGTDGRLSVGITPTYSGCPATEVIARSIRETLDQNGFADVTLETVLWPPWSSEWLSESGRRKLQAFGIAVERPAPAQVACPRCASHRLERISEFGSTPCKAHYRCRDCLEPFDTFKCL
jgi:ring-1,2-phenylacetyl-CoA epoxidase subunit PaaD